MDVARSAPQGAHYYHADVIYLLPSLGIKKRARALWYSYINSVNDQQSLYPDEQHTLTFFMMCVVLDDETLIKISSTSSQALEFPFPNVSRGSARPEK